MSTSNYSQSNTITSCICTILGCGWERVSAVPRQKVPQGAAPRYFAFHLAEGFMLDHSLDGALATCDATAGAVGQMAAIIADASVPTPAVNIGEPCERPALVVKLASGVVAGDPVCQPDQIIGALIPPHRLYWSLILLRNFLGIWPVGYHGSSIPPQPPVLSPLAANFRAVAFAPPWGEPLRAYWTGFLNHTNTLYRFQGVYQH
jgi:hypothetical protein